MIEQKKSSNIICVWAIIENIVTILVTAVLFWFTKSAWCFLLLINLNSIKIKEDEQRN